MFQLGGSLKLVSPFGEWVQVEQSGHVGDGARVQLEMCPYVASALVASLAHAAIASVSSAFVLGANAAQRLTRSSATSSDAERARVPFSDRPAARFGSAICPVVAMMPGPKRSDDARRKNAVSSRASSAAAARSRGMMCGELSMARAGGASRTRWALFSSNFLDRSTVRARGPETDGNR